MGLSVVALIFNQSMLGKLKSPAITMFSKFAVEARRRNLVNSFRYARSEPGGRQTTTFSCQRAVIRRPQFRLRFQRLPFRY